MTAKQCFVGLGFLLQSWIAVAVTNGQDFAVDLKQKCELVRQSTDQPWRKIPWQVSLIDAQKMAVEQSKPIFIWAMDGHPLGCT